jgi:hypothetical protein
MQKRRTGRIVAAAVLLAACAAALGAAATGRLPVLARAGGALASSLAGSLASSAGPPSGSADADAGSAPADAGVVVRKQTAPLSSAQLGAPLVHGPFVAACGAPDDMKVVVDATVKAGHATAVSVKTTPPNPAVAACVERAIRDLQWDVSPKAGRVTVTY